MSKDFFIMLHSQKGDVLIPFMDEEGELVMYESEAAAIEDVKDHKWAQAFGFEIFERGTGRLYNED